MYTKTPAGVDSRLRVSWALEGCPILSNERPSEWELLDYISSLKKFNILLKLS